MKLVTLCSGGLDSVTLAYMLKEQGYDQLLLHIQYGQKHAKEIYFGGKAAKELDCPFKVVAVLGAFGSDALTNSSIDVPVGTYAPENLAVTVVPNRNAIFANIAASVAVSLGYDGIALAVHGGDHEVYPDCRPEFIRSLKRFLYVATGGELEVYAPFVNVPKADIVSLGTSLGVPFADTWSCYRGGEYHCGVCSTCTDRREAFRVAGVEDPTRYKK